MAHTPAAVWQNAGERSINFSRHRREELNSRMARGTEDKRRDVWLLFPAGLLHTQYDFRNWNNHLFQQISTSGKSEQWTFASIHRYVNISASPHRQTQSACTKKSREYTNIEMISIIFIPTIRDITSVTAVFCCRSSHWDTVQRESGWRWGWRTITWRSYMSPNLTSTSSTCTKAACSHSDLLTVVRIHTSFETMLSSNMLLRVLLKSS